MLVMFFSVRFRRTDRRTHRPTDKTQCGLLERHGSIINVLGLMCVRCSGIGDAGATQLACVLSTFELTHSEVVERRRLEHARRQRAPSRHLSATKLMAAGRRVSGNPSASSLRGRKRGASPLEHGKTPKSTASSKPGKSSKQTTLDPKKEKAGGGASKVQRKKSGLPGRGGVESADSAHSMDQHSGPLSADSRSNPLLSAVVLRRSTRTQPTTLIRGNRTLLSLNLARNEIGQVGMTALLDTVLSLSRQAHPGAGDPLQPGLLRVTVHNNHWLGGPGGPPPGLSRRRRSTTTMMDRARQDDVDATARYLNAAMATRDPMLRTQATMTSTTVKPHASASLLPTYANVLEP